MKNKSVSFEELHEEYCEFIDLCGKFNFYTRSGVFQIERVKECERYLQVIKSYKKQAIDNGSEHYANQFFHMQCMINASISSLMMWRNIKESKFHEAWVNLVDAQDYISIALKISDYEGVRNLEDRLKGAEISIFPGWAKYNSPGFVETIGVCSICHKEFLECGHIENKIYMGSLCQRVDREIIDVHHIAYVDSPYDRRCIITKLSDGEGNMIDYFTWEKTGKKIDPKEGMITENVIISSVELDVT